MLSDLRKKIILTKLSNALPLRSATRKSKAPVLSGGDTGARSSASVRRVVNRGGRVGNAHLARVKAGLMTKSHTPAPVDSLARVTS